MSFFNTAYADTVTGGVGAGAAAQGPAGGMLPMLGILAVFFVITYFLIIRPQNKRAKEQRELLASLIKGVEVMTAGGIIGKVVRLNDNFVVIAVSDSVEITMQKSAITAMLPPGTMKSIA